MIRISTFQNSSAGARLLGAMLLAMVTALLPAQAATIDFNAFSGLVGSEEQFDEDGFRITALSNAAGAAAGDLVGAFVDSNSTCLGLACPVNNATTYFGALDDGLLILESASAAPFQLRGFDASYIGNDALTFPIISGLLRIQGILVDGSSVSETYALAGPTDGSFNFAHFDTSAGFAAQQFTIAFIFGFTCNSAGSCSAFNSDRGQFGIDNIEADGIALPEPGSGLMFGLGLAGLCAFARRRPA